MMISNSTHKRTLVVWFLIHCRHQIIIIVSFHHYRHCACAVMPFAILHVQTCTQRVYFYIISYSHIAKSYRRSVTYQLETPLGSLADRHTLTIGCDNGRLFVKSQGQNYNISRYCTSASSQAVTSLKNSKFVKYFIT